MHANIYEYTYYNNTHQYAYTHSNLKPHVPPPPQGPPPALPKSQTLINFNDTFSRRCRLTPSSILSSARSRSQTVTKEEIDIRLLDPRNPASGQYRPRTGASVPSKCRSVWGLGDGGP